MQDHIETYSVEDRLEALALLLPHAIFETARALYRDSCPSITRKVC